MNFFKRQLPLIMVFCLGMGMIFIYYIPNPALEKVRQGAFNWVRIIAAFTLVVGVYSLMRNHFNKIKKLKAGWMYSIVMYIFLIITVVAGLRGGSKGEAFQWIFDNINVSAAATIFSILAFYFASAAYRAFRARNIEASIMLIAALIVMFGRIPFAYMLKEKIYFLDAPAVVEWIMAKPAMAARRAILLGMCLSIIATSLRIIFGIERTYMGGKD